MYMVKRCRLVIILHYVFVCIPIYLMQCISSGTDVLTCIYYQLHIGW